MGCIMSHFAALGLDEAMPTFGNHIAESISPKVSGIRALRKRGAEKGEKLLIPREIGWLPPQTDRYP